MSKGLTPGLSKYLRMTTLGLLSFKHVLGFVEDTLDLRVNTADRDVALYGDKGFLANIHLKSFDLHYEREYATKARFVGTLAQVPSAMVPLWDDLSFRRETLQLVKDSLPIITLERCMLWQGERNAYLFGYWLEMGNAYAGDLHAEALSNNTEERGKLRLRQLSDQ